MDYNPMAPEVRANPYPYYTELRREAPVYHIDVGGFSAYAVSRYDEVAYVLQHPELFSSTAMGTTTLRGGETRMLIATDPPDHTRLRSLINRSFTPRMVADLEPHIREVTARLLDTVRDSGEMDLIADLAMPLPVTIIAELLGIDPERREDFKRWSDGALIDSDSLPPERRAAHEQDMDDFQSYFEAAIEARRAQPTGDLIGQLVRAKEEEGALTPNELIAFVALLLIAGNETTTNLLGNAMIALLDHPEQLEQARREPERIANLVEEALRFDAPVQYLFRLTTQDVEMSGTTIPQGSVVLPLFASANRDDRRYPDGDTFDITRDTQGHLAFGHGIHFCLGAPLARLEARVAFETLLATFDRIERAEDGVEYVDHFFLRGPKRLPLRFEPAAVRA